QDGRRHRADRGARRHHVAAERPRRLGRGGRAGRRGRLVRREQLREVEDVTAMGDEAHPLRPIIERYNDAWNRHDVDAIVRLRATEMVLENATAGGRAAGAHVRGHIAGIFEAWPDIEFTTRRLYVRDGLVVQEWTATATHSRELCRGELVAPPTGRTLEWKGM